MSSGAQAIALGELPANQTPKSDGFAAAWLGRYALMKISQMTTVAISFLSAIKGVGDNLERF